MYRRALIGTCCSKLDILPAFSAGKPADIGFSPLKLP